MTLTDTLVEHVLDLRYDRLPEAAVRLAKKVCLDGLGVTLAGATEPLGLGRIVTDYVRRQGGPPQSSVVAGGFRSSPGMAAFANGTLGHALDYDNTWYPLNHPTSPTLPAILALAEARGTTGRAVITAIVAAFEVQGRLRMAATGLHTGQGFHKNGTTGTFGAVAGAGRLLELAPETFCRAFGVAGSRAGSLALNTGTMTKSTHSGHAARMGVESAELAEAGLTATDDVFGPRGFFDTFLGDEQEPELLVRDFADPLRMVEAGVGFKRYPANYFTHRCIDAALALRADPRVTPDSIASVTVRFPVFDYVDRPWPRTGLDGKFSVQYTTATALLDGWVDIDTFTDERRFSADVEDLLGRVRAEFDPEIPFDFLTMHAEVVVELHDGSTLRQRVDELEGMPGVPISRSSLEGKFRRCAGRVLAPDDAAWVADTVANLEEFDDLSPLMARVRADA